MSHLLPALLGFAAGAASTWAALRGRRRSEFDERVALRRRLSAGRRGLEAAPGL